MSAEFFFHSENYYISNNINKGNKINKTVEKTIKL